MFGLGARCFLLLAVIAFAEVPEEHAGAASPAGVEASETEQQTSAAEEVAQGSADSSVEEKQATSEEDVAGSGPAEAEEQASSEEEITEGSMHGTIPEVQALSQVAGGACRGESGWKSGFTGNMQSCGMATGGANPAAGSCMSRKQRVSRACGRCMGALIECGRDHCLKECCVGQCPSSGACLGCNRRRCNAAFERCAGVNL